MAQLTLLSLMDARNAVFCSPDSELKDVLLEMFDLIDFQPSICQHIERDLQRFALGAKKGRVVKAAERVDDTPLLAGLPGRTVESALDLDPLDLTLESGRPRTLDAEAVLALAVCRAHFDSLTSRQAIDRIRDSMVLNAYFAARGRGMPSRSAMHAWLNAVSEETYELVFTAHLAMVRGEGLDGMDRVTADSFSVRADTAWPTDSGMILGLLSRAWHNAAKLPEFNLRTFSTALIPLWLKRLGSLHRAISFACGRPHSRRRIRRLYNGLFNRAELILKRLDGQMTALLPAWQEGIERLGVFTRQRAEARLDGILRDLAQSAQVVDYGRRRVLAGETVAMAEKILSLSDPSAAYIKKGGREEVIGYKPQVMRSAEGFVTAFEVQEGNPADSSRLLPLTLQHVTRTGVVPNEVSVDDGYSSALNRDALEALGVRTVSMNGAKGRKITPETEWDRPSCEKARKKRSAVESLIFTLRFKFHLYRFSRRGVAAVRTELYEKAIAHNFWRAVLLRRRAAAAVRAGPLPAAA